MFALTRALRRLLELSAGERSVLAEAALLVPLVHALQKALPYRRWRVLLTPTQLPSRQRALARRQAAALSPAQIAQAVERARRGVPGVYKCLPAAYAGHLLLHRYGYPSVVQVGVARDAQGDLEAHAWVEYEGRVLIGELPDLRRFVPFPPLEV